MLHVTKLQTSQQVTYATKNNTSCRRGEVIIYAVVQKSKPYLIVNISLNRANETSFFC